MTAQAAVEESDVRQTVPTCEDLRWYFGASESEMGRRSAGTEPGEGGGSGAPDRAMTDRRIGATTRHRKLRAQLERVGASHVVVLEAAYGPRRVPREAQRAFGDLWGVALLTAIVVDGAASTGRTREAWLTSQCIQPTKAKRETAARVLLAAERLFEPAWEAWREAVRPGGAA